MKKVIFLSALLGVIVNARAQVIDNLSNIVEKTNQSAAIEQQISEEQTESESNAARQAQIDSIIKKVEQKKPAEITPEQKSVISLKAKKDISNNVRTQSIKERRDFLTTIHVMDKKEKRRQALREGKTESEAAKIEAEVTKAKIDPMSEADMEQYLFKKAGLK